MLNIRRVDHDASSTHCWRVKVQRRKQLFTRDFSDGLHGVEKQRSKPPRRTVTCWSGHRRL